MSPVSRATAVVTIAAVALLGWNDAALQSQSGVIELTPTSASPPPVQIIPVHVGADMQGYASAGPELVAYLDGFGRTVIRYFRFSTGAIESIPLDDSFGDWGASVSGDRIAFLRGTAAANLLFVYDTSDGTTVQVPTPNEFSWETPALGGDIVATVAYVTPFADLAAYDIATSTPYIVSTDESTARAKPDVSPDGKLIVWEHCIASLINCDVQAADRNTVTSEFVVRTIAATSQPEANPDTDGTWIVYDGGDRSGAAGEDIYFTAAAGGPIQQIVLPGRQSSPSVSNGVIAFVSAAAGSKADVFAYVIATNTLYRITTTADLSEDLPDTAAAPGGGVRIAWMTNSSSSTVFDEMDVYATTFTLPQGPTYRVRLGYDPAAPGKRKQPFLIKLQILDAQGNNVSAPALAVLAASLTHATTGASHQIDDQGNSNPGFKFSFKADTSGYTYNLNTAALPAGSYVMKVAVGPNGVLLDVPFALQ